MKIHIENLNINFPDQKTKSAHCTGIGRSLDLVLKEGEKIKDRAAIISWFINSVERVIGKQDIPAIGEKWPGTDAIYAGMSLSMTGDSLVHLILWPKIFEKNSYRNAVVIAEAENPEMKSHLPTRHQSITLFEQPWGQINDDYFCWILSNIGSMAVAQNFNNGAQYLSEPQNELRFRAVSEIPV